MMSSPAIPDVHDEINESAKPKRLPRSAKKRLRYERIRQQRKEAPKKKKKPKSSIPSSSIELPTSTDGGIDLTVSTSQTLSTIGKGYRRIANERLAEINQQSTAPTICIDCAYNEAMSIKELASLARQIGRCYSSNRRAVKPVKLTLTNWSNDSPLAKECRRVNSGFDKFQIILNDKPIHESFPVDRLVYMSPNGDKQLTDVNEENVYVIGGLVDESVKKNMTYETCHNKNIACYKLPIETYMEHSITGGSFNQILSINQVFDILTSYMTTKDWRQALKAHIPERKGWVVKQISDSDDKTK